MKRLLFLPLLTVVLTITAQNEENAKEIELKGVTVQGARMVQRTDGLWLYPTRQQIARVAPSPYRPDNAHQHGIE